MPKQYIDNELLNDVVACIKHIRGLKKVTLETFYFDTGIHLARIEQGKTNITLSTLSKFCQYHNITLKEFFSILEKNKKKQMEKT